MRAMMMRAPFPSCWSILYTSLRLRPTLFIYRYTVYIYFYVLHELHQADFLDCAQFTAAAKLYMEPGGNEDGCDDDGDIYQRFSLNKSRSTGRAAAR